MFMCITCPLVLYMVQIVRSCSYLICSGSQFRIWRGEQRIGVMKTHSWSLGACRRWKRQRQGSPFWGKIKGAASDSDKGGSSEDEACDEVTAQEDSGLAWMSYVVCAQSILFSLSGQWIELITDGPYCVIHCEVMENDYSKDIILDQPNVHFL